MDSLELAPKTQLPVFREGGIPIKPLVGEAQLTLIGRKLKIKKRWNSLSCWNW
jgi:hypothetical protein